MGKLVRDLIPAIIEADGRTAETRVLEAGEFLHALLDKLAEESDELRRAEAADRLEEAADVYEVLLAPGDACGWTPDDLVARATEKRAERGGFGQRLWLESWT